MNTSNDSVYGAEESITEWLDNPHHTSTSAAGPGVGGVGGGAGVGSPGAGHVAAATFSAGACVHCQLGSLSADIASLIFLLFTLGASPNHSGSNGHRDHGHHHHNGAAAQASARLAELALGDGGGSGDDLAAPANLPTGSTSAPGSPHVLLVSGAGGNNHNTTRRKRSGIPGAV